MLPNNSKNSNAYLTISVLLIIFIFNSLANGSKIISGYPPPKHQSDSVGIDTSEINDGPYVFYKNDSLKLIWFQEGNSYEKIIQENEKINILLSKDQIPIEISIDSGISKIRNYEFQNITKFGAISDLHGQLDLFIKLLTVHKIIDNQYNWIWGDGHLVIVGDVFDRGPKVTEILWLIYYLEKQAAAAGGGVHYLLGNHEVMIMAGDLRYLHPKYLYVQEKLDIPYNRIYDQQSFLGKWLRTKPLIIKMNGYLYVHAGFHPYFPELKLNISEVNSIFSKNLGKDKSELKKDDLLNFLFRGNGTVWYRGYFKNKPYDSLNVETVLSAYDSHTIVVGHTSMDSIETYYNKKIIAIDSSIKNGKSGELLLMLDGQLYRGKLSGEKILLK